jgi:hypothetical protein
MAIPSVLAEAGFATGAGVSGAFAVVGCGVSDCGVSDFLSPHIFSGLLGQGHQQNYGHKTGVQRNVAPRSKWEQANYGRGVPFSNTGWGPCWETKHYKNARYRARKSFRFKMELCHVSF